MSCNVQIILEDWLTMWSHEWGRNFRFVQSNFVGGLNQNWHAPETNLTAMATINNADVHNVDGHNKQSQCRWIQLTSWLVDTMESSTTSRLLWSGPLWSIITTARSICYQSPLITRYTPLYDIVFYETSCWNWSNPFWSEGHTHWRQASAQRSHRVALISSDPHHNHLRHHFDINL